MLQNTVCFTNGYYLPLLNGHGACRIKLRINGINMCIVNNGIYLFFLNTSAKKKDTSPQINFSHKAMIKMKHEDS